MFQGIGVGFATGLVVGIAGIVGIVGVSLLGLKVGVLVGVGVGIFVGVAIGFESLSDLNKYPLSVSLQPSGSGLGLNKSFAPCQIFFGSMVIWGLKGSLTGERIFLANGFLKEIAIVRQPKM